MTRLSDRPDPVSDAVWNDAARQERCTYRSVGAVLLATSGAVYSNLTGDVDMPSNSDVVHSDPDILSGTPVFVGTRVPVQSLFDYLEAGDTLDEFLRQFPSVTREQAVAALELARDTLLTRARPA